MDARIRTERIRAKLRRKLDEKKGVESQRKLDEKKGVEFSPGPRADIFENIDLFVPKHVDFQPEDIIPNESYEDYVIIHDVPYEEQLNDII